MRRLFFRIVVTASLLISTASVWPAGTIHLFNGKNLDGFYTFLKDRGRNNDPKGVFTVRDGVLRISGEEAGCLTSVKTFQNYHLVAEFKWGNETHGGRVGKARDSGILLHSVGKDGAYGGIWMHSIECQIIEGGVGDFIVVGDNSDRFSITCPVASEKQGDCYVFQPGGQPATIHSGRINWWGRDPNWQDIKGFRGKQDVEKWLRNRVGAKENGKNIKGFRGKQDVEKWLRNRVSAKGNGKNIKGFRGKQDVEKPTGEWNRLECIVEGSEITVILNGVTVNQCIDVQPRKGHIQVQSEGAEIFFRRIDLTPIESGKDPAEEAHDNSRCLGCHTDLAGEPLVVQHAEAMLTCMDCHGESVEHRTDKQGAAPVDFLFGRKEIDPQCGSCHTPHKDQQAVKVFRNQWDGLRRPSGRIISADSVCTDCHGTHTLPTCEHWQRLFNGVNLDGWVAEGEARWTVENGTLVGRQGPDNKPGDLFTVKDYGDFILRVAFRVVWPANSGVWFRYQSANVAYQADILEYKNPVCWSGSLYCAGKMFLALNTEASWVNREGWNTMEIWAKGDHIRTFVNGHEIADVHDDASDHGKIGFQVHPGDEFKSMEIHVRDVLLQPLERDGKLNR